MRSASISAIPGEDTTAFYTCGQTHANTLASSAADEMRPDLALRGFWARQIARAHRLTAFGGSEYSPKWWVFSQ